MGGGRLREIAARNELVSLTRGATKAVTRAPATAFATSFVSVRGVVDAVLACPRCAPLKRGELQPQPIMLDQVHGTASSSTAASAHGGERGDGDIS